MSTRGFSFNEDDFPDKEPVPVPDLPWYNTIRSILEPYTAAADAQQSTEQFSSAELIAAIEQHHGVPQGPQQGMAQQWVSPDDFVRAMHYLGYREANYGGAQLLWLMKKKQ